MARSFYLLEFDPIANPYVYDRGAATSKIIGRFKIPADFEGNDAILDQLVTLAGGRRRTGRAACPDPGFDTRKVRFTRRDGNSLSLPIGSRADHLTVANLQAMRDLISGVDATNPVECMELIGERIPNLIDELRTTAVTVTPGTSSRPLTGGKQIVHSGQILYLTDAIFSNEVPVNVKVDTNNATTDATTGVVTTAPPTVLAAEWTTCVGAFQNTPVCPGRNPREHRRYIATVLVTEGTTTRAQKTEIPVRNNAQADILACGQAIAANTAVLCLEYRGEDNARLHKVIPATA